MDEQRLSNDKYEVTRYSHGGCTTRCMFSHEDKLMQRKPEYVLLHVGTNNIKGASDKVLKELLSKYIQKRLPSSTIFISLPMIRADNNSANTVRFLNSMPILGNKCLPCLRLPNITSRGLKATTYTYCGVKS